MKEYHTYLRFAVRLLGSLTQVSVYAFLAWTLSFLDLNYFIRFLYVYCILLSLLCQVKTLTLPVKRGVLNQTIYFMSIYNYIKETDNHIITFNLYIYNSERENNDTYYLSESRTSHYVYRFRRLF